MPLLLGAIVMWSGAVENIPDGWALCNGQNGTLDLRNRFIVGAGGLYNVGATGGNKDAVLVEHNHTGSTDTVANHGHNVNSNEEQSNRNLIRPNSTVGAFFGLSTVSHSHTLSITTVGSSATNANLPPYYALAFIQQVE